MKIKWYSPNNAPFYLAGLAWFAQNGLYRRMPKRPLPAAVDGLADNTAGVQIRFKTDSTRLLIKATLAGPADMYHMPATGQCGFDCYIGAGGASPRFIATANFEHKATAYESKLFELGRRMRYIILNFPLYQGVKELTIGLDHDARILPPPPYSSTARVVWYGTSITQGGCACRPGMAFTNILSRRLNREFINLGFSGSGRGEPEVAETIAEIQDVACYVLDYEANCPSTESLKQTLPDFIRILRRSHPRTPILVLSKILWAEQLYNAQTRRICDKRRNVQRRTVEKLRAQGDRRIFFTDGSDFLGEDWEECTVDGIHPTDLGFMRIANALTPVLKKILKA